MLNKKQKIDNMKQEDNNEKTQEKEGLGEVSNSKKILKNEINDINIEYYKVLLPPNLFIEKYKASEKIKKNIINSRETIKNIMNGIDKRFLVIIGPCSIHDPNAGIQYALALNELKKKYNDKIYIVMRTYFEKPRTTIGWKGLINDPDLNESYDINKGLKLARKFLIDVSELDLPTSCEFLETISAQYISDLICWGAIGARTSESQIHRQLSSGLSCPIGFKNSTDGNVEIVINSIISSQNPQTFLGISHNGIPSIVKTKGNKYCHVVLRGGNKGPNYDMESVSNVVEQLNKFNLFNKVLIDCSHGNCNKSYLEQINVVNKISYNLKNEPNAKKYIFGIMIESFLINGNQTLDKNNLNKLIFGKSCTDECIGLKSTIDILDNLYNSL